MARRLVQYSIGRKGLPAQASAVPNPLPRARYPHDRCIGVAAVVAIVALVLVGVIRADNPAIITTTAVVAAAIAYFAVILSSRRVTGEERSRVWGFLPLFITSVASWSLYQQQFTVLTVYSDQRLNRDLFGWEMPVSWVNSINPIFIIVLSGVFAALWTKLAPPARDPREVRARGDDRRVQRSCCSCRSPAVALENSTPLLAIIGIPGRGCRASPGTAHAARGGDGRALDPGRPRQPPAGLMPVCWCAATGCTALATNSRWRRSPFPRSASSPRCWRRPRNIRTISPW